VQDVDLSEKISALKQKLEQIEMNGQSTKKLFSEYAGYYVSLTDGSENTVSYDNIENVSAVEIEQAISDVNNDFLPGNSSKIICSFNWYLLACVDDSEAVDIKTGDEKEVLIGKNGEISLNMTVYSVNHLSADKAAIVFVCQQMNKTYAAMRVEDAQIVLSRYDGYKISNTAIRTKDGIKGVYVLRNNVVVFRKINLIESQENYCIAEIILNNSGEKGYNNIELYDEIVVEGKNLYEGKVIRR
jgi:putative membrane fusion protein